MENTTVTIFGHTLEHIANATPFGNPVFAYRVTTEDGWCIRKATLDPLLYKTTTMLYETDDFSQVEIIPESELPEGAEILGGGNTPETENA